MNKKIALAVIYGGDSTERDISVITAVQAMRVLKGKYDLCPLMLEDGAFYVVKNADDINSYIKRCGKKRVYLDKDGVFRTGISGRKRIFRPDCCLICTHGGSGENGGLQGYLDVIGIPYTSAGVTASAIGMDKALSKVIFASLGLRVTPYVVVSGGEDDVARIEKMIGYPVIVKPVAQGSSIGIAVAKDRKALESALATALSFDDRAICERALTDFTELNCAALTRGGETLVSEAEKPVGWEEFLTFEKKYLDGDGKLSGGGRIYPADVPEDVRKELRKATATAYEGIGAKGVVRVDFLLDNKTGELYVNEVNTVPGSLATYLFEENGMDYTDVVGCAVEDAVRRSENKKIVQFGSNVLDVYGKSSANACKMHGKIL